MSRQSVSVMFNCSPDIIYRFSERRNSSTTLRRNILRYTEYQFIFRLIEYSLQLYYLHVINIFSVVGNSFLPHLTSYFNSSGYEDVVRNVVGVLNNFRLQKFYLEP